MGGESPATVLSRLNLRDQERAALDAIVAGRRAWTAASVLGRMGHGAEVLAELMAIGLVGAWERGRYRSYLLTAWGAWLLGVELVEEGASERPRWEEPHEVPMRVIPGSSKPRPFVLTGPANVDGVVTYSLIGFDLVAPEREEEPAEEGEDYLLDSWTGEPLVLLGLRVPRDRRMGMGKAKENKRRGGRRRPA